MIRPLRLFAGLLLFTFFVVAGARAHAYESFVHASVREPVSGATHSVPAAERAVPVVRAYMAPVSQAAASTVEPASLTVVSSRAASLRAIRAVFGVRAPAAIRVASCETGGTFYARSVGRAGERGIFQLHPIHRAWIDRLYGWHRMFEPLQNARAAYRLSRGGTNWRAWSCGWAA